MAVLKAMIKTTEFEQGDISNDDDALVRSIVGWYLSEEGIQLLSGVSTRSKR